MRRRNDLEGLEGLEGLDHVENVRYDWLHIVGGCKFEGLSTSVCH